MAKKKNQSNNNQANDGTVTVALKIDMHCEGCAEKIVKSVQSLNGVESVKRGENDWKKLTVVGKVDPVELCEKVERKLKKKAELISPATKKQNSGAGELKKVQNVAVKDESKHKKIPVTTTVLKVPLHCRGCIEKIQKLVKKTDGFVEMSIDEKKDLVTVKGSMDMNVLIEAFKDKLNKKVEIVPVNSDGGKNSKKAKGGGGDSVGEESGGGGGPIVVGYDPRMDNFVGQGQYMYPQYLNRPEYRFNYIPASQMFNDENPNACVLM